MNMGPDRNKGIGPFKPEEREKFVRKETAASQESTIGSISMSGPNARVNIHSADYSTNSVNHEQVFSDIREEVSKGVEDSDAKHEILQKLETMRSAYGTRDFESKYRDFIAAAADYMTLLTPFIPVLTNLLQQSFQAAP